ncbi:MAG: hypothetical protein MUE30_10665 [Spirosomaceae bacterium]|nr:hypothetical protein [Spirosomataceae bacterium]
MKIVQTFTTPVSLCFLDGQVTFWQENGQDLHVLTSDKDKLRAFSQKHQVPAKAETPSADHSRFIQTKFVALGA